MKFRHVATQIVDVKDEPLGELSDVAEHDPADAQGRQPELVTRRGIDLTRGSRKSKATSGAKRGQETALAPSTWMSTSRPVSASKLSSAWRWPPPARTRRCR